MKSLTTFLLTVFLCSQLFAQTIESSAVWKHNFGEGYPCSSFLLDGNHLYFSAGSTKLRKLDASTGKMIWEAQTDIGFKGFIHGFDHDKAHIYLNGTSNGIHKVRKSDGSVVWSYDARFDDDVLNSVTLKNEILYVNPLDSGYFLALNAKDGKIHWLTDLESPVLGYSIEKDRIYCQQYNGHFTMIDLKSGKILKENKQLEKNRFYYRPMIWDNVVIACAPSKQIVAFNKKTLETVWTNTSGYFNMFSDDDHLFAYDHEFLYRIDPANGQELWKIRTGGRWMYKPNVVGSKVYLQGRRSFHILDLKTGKELHKEQFDHKSYTQPYIDRDFMYIGYGGIILKAPTPK